MEFLLDDSSIEQQFQKILQTIRLYKSGEVAAGGGPPFSMRSESVSINPVR